ncbi:MAG: metabolite traffic protein EboE [Phycisphaeraceae bacterium]
MLDVLGPNTTLGYCTNVHAGATFDEMRSNLLRYAVPVKQRVSPGAPMGVGLWLAADAANYALANPAALADFKSWMQGLGLAVYTVNGFPYGNFHQPVVKTKVYQPDWTTQARYDYTLTLAKVLAELLPEGAEGSISTLPLGWPALTGESDEALHRVKSASAGRLHDLVHQLARLELDTGKLIHINLEPEPGCLIDTAPGMVDFFQQYLLDSPDDLSVLGYLRVCHDVCHSAVMFEPQADALRAYRDAGIKVGKAQLSSAVRVPFGEMSFDEKAEAMTHLKSFQEGRYLHQTCVREPSGATTLYHDLPDAIKAHEDDADPAGEWRVHFHVPVYLDQFGPVRTTRYAIGEFLNAVQPGDELHHFEVETYAWNVLPDELKREELADGIADELAWVRETFGDQKKEQ